MMGVFLHGEHPTSEVSGVRCDHRLDPLRTAVHKLHPLGFGKRRCLKLRRQRINVSWLEKTTYPKLNEIRFQD